MKQFEEYFTEEAIVSYLCKLRAKVAKSRSKKHLIHLLTDSKKYNYHVNDENNNSEYTYKFINDLNKLLPIRKNWISLGSDSRIDKKTNQSISSFDRNYYSLKKTIKRYRKKSPNAQFLLELDNFINEIQRSISSCIYRIATPKVYPKLKNKIKKKGENNCRPITLFSLKDRVILSLTNKFITNLFDKYFEDCSYAFRAIRNKNNTAILSHHDCIKDILSYKSENEKNELWVVECDMEKFYDSVNHSIIKQLFNKLIEKAQNDFSYLELKKPLHIFNEFLNCYSFNTNVLPLNSNMSFWAEYKIPNGEFGWVAEYFTKLKYYENIDSERIGVPQGGALSGLIANIVLDVADKQVLKTNVFYARFCDDMMIIYPEQDECKNAKEFYINSLKQLKLVPHEFCDELIIPRKDTKKKLPATTIKPFWVEKSKGPFKWSSLASGGFPWIGFVGYELHYEGYIRIRKKSLHKELKKQKEVVNEIKIAIKENRRKSLGTVSESAIHRLIAMSVGRVTLKNFDKIENEMCWKNGFKELFLNKYSIQQIKHLDRNRNRLYYKLDKELQKIRAIEGETEKSTSKKRQIIHFNKPFSYFYQVLERKQIIKQRVSVS